MALIHLISAQYNPRKDDRQKQGWAGIRHEKNTSTMNRKRGRDKAHSLQMPVALSRMNRSENFLNDLESKKYRLSENIAFNIPQPLAKINFRFLL